MDGVMEDVNTKVSWYGISERLLACGLHLVYLRISFLFLNK